MRSFVKKAGLILAVAMLTIACDSNPTLQKYYVDSKENGEFISIDLPTSILQFKDMDIDDEVKKTLQTIKKINVLALQMKETNKDLFDVERKKIKEILKNPKYKELMRVNHGKSNVSVNFLGEGDAIDEVIIFGADKEKGLALLRVLGKNMNPAEIVSLSQKLKLDENSGELKQLHGLFEGLK